MTSSALFVLGFSVALYYQVDTMILNSEPFQCGRQYEKGNLTIDCFPFIAKTDTILYACIVLYNFCCFVFMAYIAAVLRVLPFTRNLYLFGLEKLAAFRIGLIQ